MAIFQKKKLAYQVWNLHVLQTMQLFKKYIITMGILQQPKKQNND